MKDFGYIYIYIYIIYYIYIILDILYFLTFVSRSRIRSGRQVGGTTTRLGRTCATIGCQAGKRSQSIYMNDLIYPTSMSYRYAEFVTCKRTRVAIWSLKSPNWPNLAFFETTYGQIKPFFGTWQP